MKPKIAWIVYDWPYPANSGGKLRVWNLIKNLAGDFEIDLFSFYRKEEQLKQRLPVSNVVRQVRVYRRRNVWDPRNLLLNTFQPLPLLNISYLDRQLEADLISSVQEKRYSIYHFEFLGVGSYLPQVKKRGGRVVMGNENVEHQIYDRFRRQSRNYFLKPLYLYDVFKMRRFEESLWRLSDANLAVSREDADAIEAVSGRPCHLVPNGIDLRETRPLAAGRPGNSAFFFGDLNYQQNRDAILWFASEVAPRIRLQVPNFKLVVHSRTRPNFVKRYQDFLKVVVDEGSSFESIAARFRLFVAPIRIKSGTNIKVLQAAANGLPLVGTSFAFAGYDFVDGQEVLTANDPQTFAESVVRIWRDPKLAQRLSANALKTVKKYTWANSAKILKDVYQRLLL